MASLQFGFPGGVGDAEATTLQRNNFSQFLQRRGWGDLSRNSGPAHRHLFQAMMLLILLILMKMIFGRNQSIARVACGGNERCVVGTSIGRCAWEAAYSADLPSSKPSSAASILWSLGLVRSDDWEAASL
jgi:hypothetical protein